MRYEGGPCTTVTSLQWKGSEPLLEWVQSTGTSTDEICPCQKLSNSNNFDQMILLASVMSRLEFACSCRLHDRDVQFMQDASQTAPGGHA